MPMVNGEKFPYTVKGKKAATKKKMAKKAPVKMMAAKRMKKK
jgi:hypothetical protein